MIGVGPLGDIGFHVFLINAFVGYPVALVAGVPLYLFCRRRRWVGFVFYVCVGLVLGVCGGLVFSVGLGVTSAVKMLVTSESFAPSAFLIALPVMVAGAICGGLSTACFWLIVRPDRLPPGGAISRP